MSVMSPLLVQGGRAPGCEPWWKCLKFKGESRPLPVVDDPRIPSPQERCLDQLPLGERERDTETSPLLNPTLRAALQRTAGWRVRIIQSVHFSSAENDTPVDRLLEAIAFDRHAQPSTFEAALWRQVAFNSMAGCDSFISLHLSASEALRASLLATVVSFDHYLCIVTVI